MNQPPGSLGGPPLSPEDFVQNLLNVRERIVVAGGDPELVKIVAVSKGQPPEAIKSALLAGHRIFGENYADELVRKASGIAELASSLQADVAWHFQGRLQTNKINRLKPFVSVWQTVDSVERADALAQRVPGATVLVQINSQFADPNSVITDRSGALLAEVEGIVAHSRQRGLAVVGLMTVGPLVDGTPNKSATEHAFRSLADLADALSLPERSMGMSGDLEEAVAAGATLVRVGAALFGARS
jgi:PLP dependent protein